MVEWIDFKDWGKTKLWAQETYNEHHVHRIVITEKMVDIFSNRLYQGMIHDKTVRESECQMKLRW